MDELVCDEIININDDKVVVAIEYSKCPVCSLELISKEQIIRNDARIRKLREG